MIDILNESLGSQRPNGGRHVPSLFNNATRFVVTQSTFQVIEHRSNIVQNFMAGTAGDQIKL